MIHSQFVLRFAEAPLHRPAIEGHTQQPPQGDSPLAWHAIGNKVLYLPAEDVAGHDQAVPATRQTIFAFAPKHRPLDLPDLRAFVRVLDAVPLPRLPAKHGRILHQVADFAGRTATHQPGILLPAAPLFAPFRPGSQDGRLLHPAVEVDGNLGHERLPTLFEAIEKLPVTTVQFVERPSRHANSIAQSPIDQPQGDLRLRAKLHLLGNVVFFRRSGSFAQSSGKYSPLPNRHWNPGAA